MRVGLVQSIPLLEARARPKAILRSPAELVLIGGSRREGPADSTACTDECWSLATTEIVDLARGRSMHGPTMSRPREGANVARLADGTLLVAGGMADYG